MVYISANGSIKNKRARNPFRCLSDAFFKLSPKWRAIALAAMAIAFYFWPGRNPLANGAIPAAAVQPQEHWATISTDLFFVRSMTENLVATNKRKSVEAQRMNKHIEEGKIEFVLGYVDFGGPDGHVLEKSDWKDLESIRGTRCSTSQSAVTAYFCGAAVAGNQDVALGNQRKGSFSGIQSFADFISCRHQQGERNGYHRRSVYRLGIGCEDSLAGYSHAFSIIAQPDGSFFWLQSFINHYSLNNWMEQVDAFGSPRGRLSLAGLQAKLKQVDRLMKINGWSSQANDDYFELFGVDKEKEAMAQGKPPVRLTWEPSHRLVAFYWDEACEYPLPPHQEPGDEDEGIKSDTSETYGYDECVAASLLEHLKETRGLDLQL